MKRPMMLQTVCARSPPVPAKPDRDTLKSIIEARYGRRMPPRKRAASAPATTTTDTTTTAETTGAAPAGAKLPTARKRPAKATRTASAARSAAVVVELPEPPKLADVVVPEQKTAPKPDRPKIPYGFGIGSRVWVDIAYLNPGGPPEVQHVGSVVERRPNETGSAAEYRLSGLPGVWIPAFRVRSV